MASHGLAVLHEEGLSPEALAPPLQKAGYHLEPFPVDPSRGWAASAASEELQLWLTHRFDAALQGELLSLQRQHPDADVVLVLPRTDKAALQEALHGGFAAVLSLAGAEEELPPLLRALRRRQEARASERLGDALLAAESGFQQGAARLLHDLNSPLTAIQNASELLEIEGSFDTESSQAFSMLTAALERVTTMVSQWHDYLHSAGAQRGEGDLAEALARSIRYTSRRYPELRWSFQPEDLNPDRSHTLAPRPLPVPTFDLEQVFSLVLDNAAEAALENSGAEPRVLVRLEEDEEQVYVSIEDSGTGVPEEIRETFWKDFVSTKGEGRHGMSLGIVRYLLLLAGGTIALKPARDLAGASLQVSLRKFAPRRVSF